jgi:CheY-like chemotaxis protein/two-component sensor histidine kinase
MSHEIRTPMTTVIGVLDYLQDANLNESQAQCLDLAEKASNTLLELIGDILDYSKIEARKLTLENRPFNIRDCIEETVAILRSSAHSKNLSLKLQLADEVQAVVYGDQLRLRQVLTNLVGNAIKFTDVGSVEVRIELTAEKNKGISQELLFSIKDSGCGIPANKMELLFESFSQVDASTTRRYGGSGLGLSICKGIVEKMGGKIWVESEEGLGSTFFFTMPIEPARQTSPNPQSSKSTGKDKKLGSKPRILLVEDDASIQQLMRITLDTKEWDLMIVSDGHEAIASWEKGAFNLILMDVQMSGMDGLTAAREIRRREPKGSHSLIMALTAHAHEQARKECLEAGMDDILIKPLRLENLKDIVNKYLIQHIEQPTKQ